MKELTKAGTGPIYGFIIFTLTVLGIIFRKLVYLDVFYNLQFIVFMHLLGFFFFLSGVFIWVHAVLISEITKKIENTELMTTGIYAWVRNPIYTGISFFLMSILFFSKSVFSFILPFIFWIIMTLLVKPEEKVLERIFGDKYLQYKKRVNRCIPWFPQKRNH